MKKKLLVLALIAALMMLALAACGAEKQEDADASPYAELVGEYQDSVSQRAVLAAVEKEDGLEIAVEWANSAEDAQVWLMNAAFNDEGQLAYTDCKCTAGADGKVVSEDGSGYFEVQDGKLLWTGAEDEQCRECVFEKTGE